MRPLRWRDRERARVGQRHGTRVVGLQRRLAGAREGVRMQRRRVLRAPELTAQPSGSSERLVHFTIDAALERFRLRTLGSKIGMRHVDAVRSAPPSTGAYDRIECAQGKVRVERKLGKIATAPKPPQRERR